MRRHHEPVGGFPLKVGNLPSEDGGGRSCGHGFRCRSKSLGELASLSTAGSPPCAVQCAPGAQDRSPW
jgi:hypothetical protein